MEAQQKELIKKYQTTHNCQLLFLLGDIDENLSLNFRNLLKTPDRASNLHIILRSRGGDPHAAYRIINLAQETYEKVEVLVPYKAKSAATLLCLGANQIRMSPGAELGPLDMQVSAHDDPMRNTSGLVATNAIQKLRQIGTQFVDDYVMTMLPRTGRAFKISELIDQGIRFSIGALEPLTRQIDPRIASEHDMSLRIADEYGKRLMQRYHFVGVPPQTSQDAIKKILTRLIYEYPDHGFVIDLQEARSLNLHVDAITPEQQEIIDFWDGASSNTNIEPALCFFVDALFTPGQDVSSSSTEGPMPKTTKTEVAAEPTTQEKPKPITKLRPSA